MTPVSKGQRNEGFSFPLVRFPADWRVLSDTRFQLVRLNNGICSVRSLVDEETFHPVVGPVAEAQALYVNQLQLRQRLLRHAGEFVIWDVGLGAAANTLTVLKATRDIPCRLRILSFDRTGEPLEFALTNARDLGYFGGYEDRVRDFLGARRVAFEDGPQTVNWEFHHGDFPSLVSAQVAAAKAQRWPAPHAVLFDAYSPARNPVMWTLPLFSNLFGLLDSQRPCALSTYSRSTILRVTLLLAGFYVGAGHATGEKEETTIASNDPAMIVEPLGPRWLERAARSHSAEPMTDPVYRTEPLSDSSMARLRAHPQFA